MKLSQTLRQDNFWVGTITGILVPSLIFGILTLILALVEHFTGKLDVVSIQKIILLSVVPNLFILRYYLLKLKYDLTGRGILTATFVIGLLFVVLEFTVK
ncbi:MAG: hypothetical protein LBV46_00105 [Bacteroidales bacterium]|jgi:uncharacterized membrane-anchored protein|nr:hypothetical protein [Bacteroidales bacterium]